MMNRDENPEFLNSFLDYSITILNKSPKQYSNGRASVLYLYRNRISISNTF